MHAAWHWLILNGLWKDLLAAFIALAVTRAAAWRPLKRLGASQRRIEDALDTRSPGGLHDVVKALRRDDGKDSDDDDDDDDVDGRGQGHPHDVTPLPPMHHIR